MSAEAPARGRVRRVLVHPHPVLRARCEPAAGLPPEARARIAADLCATMGAHAGCVGLAAPQIGEPLRIAVVDASRGRRPCRNHGLLVMLDPEIVAREGEALGREGCLSVPDWTGIVRRAARVRVRFATPAGETREIEARGFEARAIQHELDHLDGVLFLDRVASPRDLVRR